MNASNNKRGVYTLKVDKKDINLLFSMNFWRILSQEGIEPEQLGDALSGKDGVIGQLEALSKVILAGGKSYAVKHKTQFKYDIDEVFDWLEEDINNDTMNEMFLVMMDTKMFGQTINQGLNRQTKGKKQPSRK